MSKTQILVVADDEIANVFANNVHVGTLGVEAQFSGRFQKDFMDTAIRDLIISFPQFCGKEFDVKVARVE